MKTQILLMLMGVLTASSVAHANVIDTLATCTLASTTTSGASGCSISAGQHSYVLADIGSNVQAAGAKESLQTYGDSSIIVDDQNVPGTAAISETADVITDFDSSGPARTGEITITNTTADKGGLARPDANASVIISDGVHTYTFGIVCDTEVSCGIPPTETVAFNLGSTFSVEEKLSLSDSFSNAGGVQFYDTAAAEISFTLSDPNGNPVVSNLVPEPSTLGLFGLVSLLAGAWIVRRKRNSTLLIETAKA
jgi:hypothetical protein